MKKLVGIKYFEKNQNLAINKNKVIFCKEINLDKTLYIYIVTESIDKCL